VKRIIGGLGAVGTSIAFFSFPSEDTAMMLIDMTNELAPILYGLNVALVASALGVLVSALAPWLRSLERPRVPTWSRPAMAGR